MFDELAASPPSARSWTVVRVVLLVVSAVLFGLTLALLALGGWLIAFHFPDVTILLGLVCVGVAVLMRPRWVRRPSTYDVLTREAAPTLFALVGRVADAVGTRAPDSVVVDAGFNASAGSYGLRRRRLLCLGLPLWGVLDPQERVALLGHELGHFVNGDPAQGLLTQPAFTTLGRLAGILAPEGLRGRTGLEAIALALVRPVFWVVSRAAYAAQLGLLVLGMRDRQRAEYAADAVAVRVAGSAAAARLFEDLAAATSIRDAIRTVEVGVRSLRSDSSGVVGWREAADRVRRVRAGWSARARQESIVAAADLFASHPPAGLRARMVASWPAEGSVVVLLGAAESAAIDRELAAAYRGAGRDIVYQA
jgi:Zn-dependent protease with chaperone function